MTWIDNSREPIGINFDEFIKTDSRRTGWYTGVQPSDGINERI